MAKKNAASDTNPFSTTSSSANDAASALDVETIGENTISPADLAAEKLDDDLTVQNNTNTMQTQNQEQGMGTPSSEFNPVGSSSAAAVGVGGDNPFDTTTLSADAPPALPAPLPSASEVVGSVKNKASDAAGQAKATVGQAADQAKATVGQAADQVKAQTQEAFTQTKQAAGEAFGKAKENVVSQLETQLDRATDSLGGLTAALRQTGDQFKGQNIPLVPDYAEQFAGQLDRVSAYLKDNDVEQLARDAESFARRNPALFIGGAFLLGIGIARFIKSSGAAVNTYNPDNLPARLSDVTPSSASAFSGEDYSGPTPTERQDINDDDAIPSGRVMSAHNYVPGIGVTGSSE